MRSHAQKEKKVGYVRLQQANDWGVDYLTLPGKALGGPYKTADARRGIKFHDGQKIRVRWPDGSESQETIVHHRVFVNVSDMGRTSRVTFKKPGVETAARGVKHWTPLAELEVWEEDVSSET